MKGYPFYSVYYTTTLLKLNNKNYIFRKLAVAVAVACGLFGYLANGSGGWAGKLIA